MYVNVLIYVFCNFQKYDYDEESERKLYILYISVVDIKKMKKCRQKKKSFHFFNIKTHVMTLIIPNY